MVIHDNSKLELKNIDSDNVDLLLTDPPYGISFIGKEWDRALPDIEIWEECLRILKPGAFAIVMSIPIADCFSRINAEQSVVQEELELCQR